jgi:histidinol-phosphatase (PHP family)
MQQKNILTADYHIHTPYCGHAQGAIIEYVNTALEKGLSEICFTDHLGRYYLKKSQKKRYWDWGMDQSALERYVTELQDVAVIYKDEITIKTGLEIDYIEGAEDILTPLIDIYPFDFLLGSIHCLPSFGWKHIANYTVQDSWPLFREYFSAVKTAIVTGIFSAIAHIDFIWRYAKWPDKNSPEIFNALEEIACLAAKRNTAIELNSNGYLWSQIYTIRGGDPFHVLLEALKKHNTSLTIGSDAHKPEYVGKAFGDIASVLKLKGILRYCTYDKKVKTWKTMP